MAEEKVGEWGDMIAKQVAIITDLAVSRALEKSRETFEAFRHGVEEQANKLYAGSPTLHVKINDEPAKKLSKRTSKSLPRLIANARLGLYTLLVGPAGCGKTTLAYQVAESLGLPFGSVCLTAGASETWLFGRQTPTGFVEGPFAKAYRVGGVFLADEMDAADANLLLSINTALSHTEMLNPMNGEVIKKHEQFAFIGAANTNGKGSTHAYTGRSRLDAATLDRMIIIEVDYDTNLEKELCPDSSMQRWLMKTREGLKAQGYDEFISTRAFLFSHRQLQAGIGAEDICDSLIANWGDAAKDVAKSEFKKAWSAKNDQNEKDARRKFYSKFVDPNLGEKWRPVQWKSEDIPF